MMMRRGAGMDDGTVRHGKRSLVPVRCGPHAHCLRG